MPLNKGKHIIQEINGVRCSVVETGATLQRIEFLKEILTLNKYEVQISLENKKEGAIIDTYTIGVSDLLFNPVLDVYKRRLISKTGHKVTPAYWLQVSNAETEIEVNYWINNNQPK